MIYFILSILFIIAALSAFFGGFLFGAIYRKKTKTPDLPPISEQEQKKAERIKREYDNFLNYTGDEQPDIEL